MQSITHSRLKSNIHSFLCFGFLRLQTGRYAKNAHQKGIFFAFMLRDLKVCGIITRKGESNNVENVSVIHSAAADSAGDCICADNENITAIGRSGLPWDPEGLIRCMADACVCAYVVFPRFDEPPESMPEPEGAQKKYEKK